MFLMKRMRNEKSPFQDWTGWDQVHLFISLGRKAIDCELLFAENVGFACDVGCITRLHLHQVNLLNCKMLGKCIWLVLPSAF